MALIGKIRQNFWLVLVLLGLALASFVLMDIMGSNSAGGLFNQTNIGDVNGEKIDYQEFSRVENALFSGNSDVYGRRNSVWNYLVEKKLVDSEATDLGLGVSKEELMDLQFGTNLSPVIQNNFRNPQTGQVDRQQLLQIKQSIEAGEDFNPQFREYWANQENQIIKTSLQEKINSLVAKAMYTPNWQAEVVNNASTETGGFAYVRVGYDKVENVEVTDEDYEKFLSNNSSKYFNKTETRLVDYVVFDVIPTSADSQMIKDQVSSLIPEFKATNKDSLFAFNNGGGYSFVYSKVEDLQGQLKDQIVNLEKGDTYGPYLEGGYYQVVKVVDKAIIPDSIEARHILRTVNNGNPVELSAANTYIDSLMNELRNGARFDSLAVNNSQDPGSSFKGGELGTFAQGTMVAPFNNAVFVGSEVGGLYKVTTQFGVHLIEVQDKIYETREPKYKLALIGSAIVPSEKTQDELYDKASELMQKNRTLEDLRKASSEQGVEISTSKALKENDFTFGNLGGGEESRSIIKWAFQAEKGEVSPAIYTYTDPVNYYNKNYVIVGLNSIQKPGRMTVEEAKSSISNLVINSKKAEEIKSKISGTDLESIASSFGTVVDTARNVSFNSGFIPGSGSEPKVVAQFFKGNQGDFIGPVEGTSGVFVGKMISRNPAVAAANLPQVKRTINGTNRGQVSFRLWEALKEKFDIKDSRSRFF